MISCGKFGISGKAAPRPKSTEPTMKVLATHQPESRGAHSTLGWKYLRNIGVRLEDSCKAWPLPTAREQACGCPIEHWHLGTPCPVMSKYPDTTAPPWLQGSCTSVSATSTAPTRRWLSTGSRVWERRTNGGYGVLPSCPVTNHSPGPCRPKTGSTHLSRSTPMEP